MAQGSRWQIEPTVAKTETQNQQKQILKGDCPNFCHITKFKHQEILCPYLHCVLNNFLIEPTAAVNRIHKLKLITTILQSERKIGTTYRGESSTIIRQNNYKKRYTPLYEIRQLSDIPIVIYPYFYQNKLFMYINIRKKGLPTEFLVEIYLSNWRIYT